MTLRLPKKVQLAGFDIDVIFKEGLHKKYGCLGLASYDTQEIWIEPKIRHEQMRQQTFMHELVHWILFTMGEFELQKNEKFVEVFAHFLYQALKPSFCGCPLPGGILRICDDLVTTMVEGEKNEYAT